MENIRLIEIKDVGLIKHVLADEEMWERIRSDGIYKENIIVPICDAVTWLGVFCDGKIAGVFSMFEKNKITADVHIHILAPYRKKCAIEAGRLFIEYFAKSKYEKIIAEIGDLNQSVCKYAERVGMRKEGINRKSIMRDGIIYDQVMYGMTKEEAKEWLQQQQ